MKKTYAPVTKNASAVARLSAWLTAVSIQHTTSGKPGWDLTVHSQEGKEVKVAVSMVPTDTFDAEVVVLHGKKLTGKGKAMNFAEFHLLTEALGYGKPIPVDRGEDPATKLHFNDNFELVSMRHMQFRRAPNPSKAELDKYSNTIRLATMNFFRTNESLCRVHMVEIDDLKTYAMVWTTNYLGNFKVLNPIADDENDKKLHVYLKQCFSEFRAMLFKKGRNTLPEPDTALICTYGHTVDENAGAERFTTDLRETFDAEDRQKIAEYQTRRNKLDLATPSKRKQSASDLLSSLLSELPHDELVSRLSSAAENHKIHIDARREANRQLRAHVESCEECRVAA